MSALQEFRRLSVTVDEHHEHRPGGDVVLGLVLRPEWAKLVLHGDGEGNFKTAEVRSRLGMVSKIPEGTDIHLLQSRCRHRCQGTAAHLHVGIAKYVGYEIVPSHCVQDYYHMTLASRDDIQKIYPKASEVYLLKLEDVREVPLALVPLLPGYVGFMPFSLSSTKPFPTISSGTSVMDNHAGWEAAVADAIRCDEGLQQLQAMAPLLENFNLLPGDFAPSDYDGDICLQLLSVGVKLHCYQSHMLKHRPRATGGQTEYIEKMIYG